MKLVFTQIYMSKKSCPLAYLVYQQKPYFGEGQAEVFINRFCRGFFCVQYCCLNMSYIYFTIMIYIVREHICLSPFRFNCCALIPHAQEEWTTWRVGGAGSMALILAGQQWITFLSNYNPKFSPAWSIAYLSIILYPANF